MYEMEISEDRFLEFMSADFPDFKITRSNLAYPTSEFVASYYTTLLKETMQMEKVEQIWGLTEAQMTFLNSYLPEASILEQHTYAYNLYVVIKYIFNHLFPNFHAEFFFIDILLPQNTPHRTFVFMSMMLNYYYYYIQVCDSINDDMIACEQKSNKLKELELTKEKLMAELADQEILKSSLGEKLKEKRALIIKSTEVNEEQQQILRDYHSKHVLLQEDLQKCEEEEQKLQEILTKLDNEKKYSQSLIVLDQNQVMDIHSKRLSMKEKCVQKMKGLEDQVNNTTSKLTQFNKVIELHQKLNNILKDEKFSSETQSKHKDFKYLHDTMHALKEKMSHYKDDEELLMIKIHEAEEMLPKLKSESYQQESVQAAISCKGKERTGTYIDFIDNKKKTHSQLLILLQNESANIGKINDDISDLTKKCDALKQTMRDIDEANQENYIAFVKELKEALNSLGTAFNGF